jgi:hypothetical protein
MIIYQKENTKNDVIASVQQCRIPILRILKLIKLD